MHFKYFYHSISVPLERILNISAIYCTRIGIMGRYAFFSTGFEYKFGFGVQDSEDMMTFGGEEKSYNSDGDAAHSWTEGDKTTVLEELLDILDFHGSDTDLDKFIVGFPANEKGTTLLYSATHKEFAKVIVSDPLFCRFRLGCLIYHQLLYKPNLEVQYEL